MALTKEVAQDKIEVLEDGTLQVRTVTRVLEDGVVIGESYHRRVVEPGDDLTGESGMAKEIAEKVHTQARKDAHAARGRS